MSFRAPIDHSKGRPEPILALDRIREVENNEPLVDIREVAPKIHILRPQVIPWCREKVALMLREASEKLPTGYRFGIIEAWRPILRQKRIFDFVYKSAQEAYPDRSPGSLKRTTCRFVAPVDHPAPPGHSTGAAIDVNLLTDSFEPVDVSSPYTHFKASATYTLGLAPEAHKHRMMIVETMLEVGFSNCRDEWWHYSYGDAGWAVRMDENACFYGLIELDQELYEEQEKLWLEAFKDRKNPFLEGN